MSSEERSADGNATDDRRRRFLGYAAIAAFLGTGAAGAWHATRKPGESDPTPTHTPEPIDNPTGTPADEVPAIVRRYAPDLYFGRLEKWFPTDPRTYVVETDDGPVVDGFTALEAYSAAFAETDGPPAPMVFYNVVEAAEGIDAIQYWLYSVFDQFTVNFHWHDWELFQVFVDRETERPLLVSASAHARAVPNNEFLEPDLTNGRRPGILAEVGSHSSASEVNDVVPSFERIATDSWFPDISNNFVDVTTRVRAPFAYGLPRDEGARLPFVMPELDGTRLDEHPGLSVRTEDFVDASVTVDDWRGLPRPPTGLPLREPGLVLAHSDSPTVADATYDLEPIAVVRDAVDDFVGPQLSFEFAIPGFLEDRFADHITSVGIPWEQERFSDPLADVTDPGHRRRIDGLAPSGLSNRVVGRVRQLQSGVDGTLDRVREDAREAVEDAATVSLFAPSTEVVARLASRGPTATATRSGTFGFLHVDPGEHLLVVNGPGFAPHAERFVHEGGLLRAGTEGEMTVIAKEDAAWIKGDARETNGVERVRIVEDYAGVVYDGQPTEDDHFAVAVHRDGHYTVEVVDRTGRPGAYRIGPEAFVDGDTATIDAVETGKAALVRALRDSLVDLRELTRTLAERDGTDSGVVRQVSDAVELAGEAVRHAEAGDAKGTNDRLSRVVSSLEGILERLQSDGREGYRAASVAALDPRVREAIERAETAIRTDFP